MDQTDRGHVQRYPCNCSGREICWIVRHPDLVPPISFETEEEANEELEKLRKNREGL